MEALSWELIHFAYLSLYSQSLDINYASLLMQMQPTEDETRRCWRKYFNDIIMAIATVRIYGVAKSGQPIGTLQDACRGQPLGTRASAGGSLIYDVIMLSASCWCCRGGQVSSDGTSQARRTVFSSKMCVSQARPIEGASYSVNFSKSHCFLRQPTRHKNVTNITS